MKSLSKKSLYIYIALTGLLLGIAVFALSTGKIGSLKGIFHHSAGQIAGEQAAPRVFENFPKVEIISPKAESWESPVIDIVT